MSDLITPSAAATVSVVSEHCSAAADLDVAAELQLLVTQVALLKQEMMEGDLLVNAAPAASAATVSSSTIDSCVSIIK